MYVHHGSGLCFLANPRTASRAVAKALLGIGFEMVGSHHSGPEEAGAPRLVAPEFFCVVRDEEQMVASWARHMGCEPGEVEVRLEKGRAIIEGWRVGFFPHLRHADIVLNYACLEEDLNHSVLIPRGLGIVVLEQIG